MDKYTIRLDDGRVITFDYTEQGYSAMYSALIGSAHAEYRPLDRGLIQVTGNVLHVNFQGR